MSPRHSLVEMTVFELEVVTKFMKHPVDRRKDPRADVLTSTVITLVLRVSTNRSLCLATTFVWFQLCSELNGLDLPDILLPALPCSSVSIVTRLRPGHFCGLCSIHDTDSHYLLPKLSRPLVGPGVQLLDHSSADIKIAWSCTSMPTHMFMACCIIEGRGAHGHI
jgi:hypothetical protein